ncbi:MAG: cobyric acid synthase [Desulfobacterales bacterium]|nr:cobyric acid synthase [Desulfobacterales bacterium]
MKKKAKCIAVFGTGSDVGKSVVTTGLCRHFAEQGLKVVPYKAQNMSNNSGVTPEGLEMGRAQLIQAEAAGVVPTVLMNPVLLKPTGETGSQVVLLGKVDGDETAAAYHQKKERYFKASAEALDTLRDENDLVIMEGAGSCAEVNLMAGDIVNFRMAEHADADVILVADIHRGGVFGQVVGTLACLPEPYAKRVKGVVINRFRGDISLFKDGCAWIEEKTGVPVLGVLPWYKAFHIGSEDSVVIEQPKGRADLTGTKPVVAVIRLPFISNFTDFEPLMQRDDIELCYLDRPCDLSDFFLVIIPGSKNTRKDLAWLKETGWDACVQEYSRAGGHVTGICGGYQILGETIEDPMGVEGHPGSEAGLGLLPVVTIMKAPKTTTLSRFTYEGIEGSGYEIHMGTTTRKGSARPLVDVLGRNGETSRDQDGCVAAEGRVKGTYMHGIFDTPAISDVWLKEAGIEIAPSKTAGGHEARMEAYAQLAVHVREHLDMNSVTRMAE